MKKAFSLLELIIVLSLASFLFLSIFSLMTHFQKLNTNHKSIELIKLNSALIQIDKFLSRCIEFKQGQNSYTCLLKDSANLLLFDEGLLIGSSGLLINKKDFIYEVPKSHFVYDLSSRVYKGVLKNHNDLFAKKSSSKELFIYTLGDKRLKNVEVVSTRGLSSTKDELQEDFFLLVESKIAWTLEDDKLYFSTALPNADFNTQSLMLEDLSLFEIKNLGQMFDIRLCMHEFCLQKLSY